MRDASLDSARSFLLVVLANSTKMCYTYDDLSRVTSRTIKNLDDDSVISAETFTYVWINIGMVIKYEKNVFEYVFTLHNILLWGNKS